MENSTDLVIDLPELEGRYACPVCKQGLSKIENSFACLDGHSFDIAKEGHVNFLLANQKGSQNPGDDLNMVKARFEWLNKGYFDFWIEKIAKMIVKFKPKAKTVLDIGCGPGYYLASLKEKLGNTLAYGLDISKDAVKFSAKKYKNLNWAVGNSFFPPFLDEVFEVIVSVFAPFSEEEMLRILKKGGILVVIRPTEKHLMELKEEMKINAKGKEFTLDEEKWDLLKKENLSREIVFKQEGDVIDLVSMSPMFWILKNNQQALDSLKVPKVSADVNIFIFQKK